MGTELALIVNVSILDARPITQGLFPMSGWPLNPLGPTKVWGET